MDAIYHKEGDRPVVAVVKSLASALSIGSGASVGREGPIIQIGAAFGSSSGRFIRLRPAAHYLVAAGGGGGIAATFNTPMGGDMFRGRTDDAGGQHAHIPPWWHWRRAPQRSLVELFFGDFPAFDVPLRSVLCQFRHPPCTFLAAGLYALLGVVVGVAAAGFIRGLHLAEEQVRSDRKPLSAPRRSG